MAMVSITVGGLLAIGALFSFKWVFAARVIKILVLLVAIISGGLMAQTAHLGGQIRHTEIGSGAVAQNGNNPVVENQSAGNNPQPKEQDDD